MNRNILFLLFILLISILHFSNDFREGLTMKDVWKINPFIPSKKQKQSCKFARKLWESRNKPPWNKKGMGKMLNKMIVKAGKFCGEKPCQGSIKNNWKCLTPKSNAAQEKACDKARKMWAQVTDEKHGGNFFEKGGRKMAMKAGRFCTFAPCGGNPNNDWRCQDKPGAKKRLKEWKESQKNPKSTKDQNESCKKARTFADVAARSRGNIALTYKTKAMVAGTACMKAPCRGRPPLWRCRDEERPAPSEKAVKSCDKARKIFAMALKEKNKGAKRSQHQLALKVGRECMKYPCEGNHKNDWRCYNFKRPEPSEKQINSCKVAKELWAKRNAEGKEKSLGKRIEARTVGINCSQYPCNGDANTGWRCHKDFQPKIVTPPTPMGATEPSAPMGATAPSATAAIVAGGAPSLCSKCDEWTIARNLGEQYRNDPNICKTRKDEAQCADAGGLWNEEVPKPKKIEKKTDWNIEIDKESGNLVFKHGGEIKSTLTKTGEWSSNSRKCGSWNIRDTRIGIPNRGDIQLHKDGIFRCFKYNSPENSTEKSNLSNGGFAGRELWYAGSAGGKLNTKL